MVGKDWTPIAYVCGYHWYFCPLLLLDALDSLLPRWIAVREAPEEELGGQYLLHPASSARSISNHRRSVGASHPLANFAPH